MCLFNNAAGRAFLCWVCFSFQLKQRLSRAMPLLRLLLSNVLQPKTRGGAALPCLPQHGWGSSSPHRAWGWLCPHSIHEGWAQARVKGSDGVKLKAVMCPGCLPGLCCRFECIYVFSLLKQEKLTHSLASDVPASAVGFFLFLQLRWRSTGDKRISAASLGGGGSRLLQNCFLRSGS